MTASVLNRAFEEGKTIIKLMHEKHPEFAGKFIIINYYLTVDKNRENSYILYGGITNAINAIQKTYNDLAEDGVEGHVVEDLVAFMKRLKATQIEVADKIEPAKV